MIYLDNAATTRVFDCAAEQAAHAMREQFFNPNATYKSGVAARESIEKSRQKIAECIGAQANELIFTSCATESNNWVFDCAIKHKKGNVVVSAGEHSSVYECAMRLKSRGVDVRFAPLKPDGAIDEQKLFNLADGDTALVSIIHVSNETGVVNPIKKIASKLREVSPRAVIHSDGVQGLLKTSTPLDGLGVDYYSASAHKIGAPKGIGLLYKRNGMNIAPMIVGGGQENGLRSGTQNTPYIAAFASAVERFSSLADNERTIALRNELSQFFTDNGCKIIGSAQNSGYILCVCIPGAKAEIVQNIAHDNGVIIGKGAACSGSKRGNRVLYAMGVDPKDVECCIRISLFVDTSRDDAMNAAQIILNAAKQITHRE